MWNGGSGTRGQAGFASGHSTNYGHQGGPRMGQSHGQTGGGSGANIEAMNWEELYDSGNLEVHLKTQLNIGHPVAVPPGPPPPIHHMYHGGQMRIPPSHTNGDINRTQVIQPLMSLVTRPPVDCQVPPPPLPHPRIMMRPAYENYNSHPPPPLFTQPPPPIVKVTPAGQRMLRADVEIQRLQMAYPGHSSFRGSSGSAKYSSKNSTNAIQTAESDSNIFSKPIEVEVISDHPRTQYRAPEPKVKILKRPSSTPSNLSGQELTAPGQGTPTSATAVSPTSQCPPDIDPHKTIQIKSLKEREEEYNQARLRIFGSIDPSSVENADESGIVSNEIVAASSPSKTPNSSNHVVRLPKGPDGTVGFKLKR